MGVHLLTVPIRSAQVFFVHWALGPFLTLVFVVDPKRVRETSMRKSSLQNSMSKDGSGPKFVELKLISHHLVTFMVKPCLAYNLRKWGGAIGERHFFPKHQHKGNLNTKWLNIEPYNVTYYQAPLESNPFYPPLHTHIDFLTKSRQKKPGERLRLAKAAMRLLHWNLCLDFLESSTWAPWQHQSSWRQHLLTCHPCPANSPNIFFEISTNVWGWYLGDNSDIGFFICFEVGGY